ncbi:MAG: PilZ domain-containing protein [Candidatus Omnitrophica bacterium]|nr:PilZ domain-containing protein [Candidatus Omnitrophota bacterium]
MLFKNKTNPAVEQRKYLRLDTVFPVQFRLEELDGAIPLSGWLQGFTNNISRGGICLFINNIDQELFKLIKEKKCKLSLEIDIPISKKPISAQTSIVWVQEAHEGNRKYMVGLNYDHIPVSQNNMLMRYSWFRKLFVPLSLSIVALLILILSINSYLNFTLTCSNKLLVEKLASVLKDSGLAKQKIEKIIAQRQDLQVNLRSLEERIKSLGSQKTQIETINPDRIKQLNESVAVLTVEKLALEAKLTEALHTENFAVKELSKLDEKKVQLQKAILDKMYQWLKVHQNNRTGLVSSFEGDQDIANWSFTYDLALLIQAYTYFEDFDRAKKILDFFAHDAKRENGWFLNAYYSDDGGPAEFIMHSGPNLWVGIAIMQYMQKSKDRSYLDLAQSIAYPIISLQNADTDGGIRGGPNVEWYSTEHNLDAYAFFNMLAKVTGKKVYTQAALKAINWLLAHTYDRPDLPVKRGKGDSTIATDTYAWSIAAIGPQKLQELGMNPDKIMEFVEENCGVEAGFLKPGGENVTIKGFDFAPQLHLARGCIVSSEWTAQMVVSYKIMEDFYSKGADQAKAAIYREKAQMYLNELGNMVISSASPSGQGQGCLPYATQDHVDTGHGWMTPKGSHTGSVSGTVYALFAYYGFNPLELKE